MDKKDNPPGVEFNRTVDELFPAVVFHRTIRGVLDLPPPPLPERFYTEDQIVRLEKETLDVDGPRAMYWMEYHIQWSYLQIYFQFVAKSNLLMDC